MLKRILSIVVVVGFLALSGVMIGCEDEVKTHREVETTTVEQEPVVVP